MTQEKKELEATKAIEERPVESGETKIGKEYRKIDKMDDGRFKLTIDNPTDNLIIKQIFFPNKIPFVILAQFIFFIWPCLNIKYCKRAFSCPYLTIVINGFFNTFTINFSTV